MFYIIILFIVALILKINATINSIIILYCKVVDNFKVNTFSIRV